MPSPEESKKAGVSDVADWAEKDVSSAYPPGTRFDLGDGKPIDVSALSDHIGGSKRKAPAKPKGRPPERSK